MLVLSNISKRYGPQSLFEDVNLQFFAPNCYGLVGANGSGKSTLLRILCGTEESTTGDVALPKKARVGVLAQDHFAFENTPIIDVVMMGNPELWAAMEEKEAILAQAHETFDADRYTVLEDIILRFDGYNLEVRAAEILEGLNIPAANHRDPLSSLSGGYKLRVLLAQTLASEPDILLLDEPTNHLDIVSVRWFEGFLREFRGCVVVVSHDRCFLDNVCTHIADVDYEQVQLYTGNYTQFEASKAAHREHMEREISKKKKEIADNEDFIRRFKAKATKARQAQSRVKRLAKITVERLPETSRRFPRFKFQQCRPSGKMVLEVDNVTKAYGENRVLDSVSFTIGRGEKVAVIGPNGIGKSTLLKIIADGLEPNAGQAEWGHEVYPGYFSQDHGELIGSSNVTLQDWLWQFCPTASIGFVRAHLAMALFTQDDASKKVLNLSGGESARLIFARLAVTTPNVLILDEPTNHLDLEGVQALCAAVKAYEGTVIVVSHDRWFVAEIADRILDIGPDGIDDFPGTYEDFARRAELDHLDTEAVIGKAAEERRSKRRKKRS